MKLGHLGSQSVLNFCFFEKRNVYSWVWPSLYQGVYKTTTATTTGTSLNKRINEQNNGSAHAL